jgi:hypothetical protein
MTMKKLAGTVAATAALLLIAPAAYADTPPPPACGFSCPSIVVVGNWLWLPSIGVAEYQWAYVTPGSPYWHLLRYPV